MKAIKLLITCFLLLTFFFTIGSENLYAQKPKVKIGWSIYVGWMPWDYADASGILKKWGDKYDVELQLLPKMDYKELAFLLE